MVAQPKRRAAGEPVAGPPAFSADTFRFFKALDFHQDRAWFQANREMFEQSVRSPMIAVVDALVVAMRRRKLPFLGDPKTSILRIHRDVRFTKDKRPYNAHAAMMLSRTGRRDAAGKFYLQIDPKGSFVAAGFYRPEPADLLKLRRAIAARPARFLAMQAALKRGGLALDPEDQLTRLPAGFSDIDPRIDAAVRLKSFFVLRDLQAKDVMDHDALVAVCVDFAAAAMPLMRLGWDVLT
ncbi:MAG TPA: DUF2461 domain-containing protein [Vineibacter sp.]|nr:DUF2461 domain-containing protein [Vineibacter sp.]